MLYFYRRSNTETNLNEVHYNKRKSSSCTVKKEEKTREYIAVSIS